jgi:hypothetical protein
VGEETDVDLEGDEEEEDEQAQVGDIAEDGDRSGWEDGCGAVSVRGQSIL